MTKDYTLTVKMTLDDDCNDEIMEKICKKYIEYIQEISEILRMVAIAGMNMNRRKEPLERWVANACKIMEDLQSIVNAHEEQSDDEND